ncbi:MAG: DUF1576 domain-containing protein [Erysipelotrichales bacterium]|nr:DUF1576 domain-containing protein [Erysipelotrichales bacterium]
MKRLQSLSTGDFLKIFFAILSLTFLLASLCMPDRIDMLKGLIQIISCPCKAPTNYFAIGGYAATFLNMGLVALVFLGLIMVYKEVPSNVTCFGMLLTIGFSSWGINVVNMWPSVLGVMIYGMVRKNKSVSLINMMLFSTGIAPMMSDLMLRYPNNEVVGFNVRGIVIALLAGLVIAVILQPGLVNSPKVHKGFDLYSAALPIGMTAFLLNACLYRTMGISVPAGYDASLLTVSSTMIVNIFCIVLFGGCVVLSLCMGASCKEYVDVLGNKNTDESHALFLLRFGIYGLFILGYYNLIGATFNGVTFGVIFCMVCGFSLNAHPGNVWPIMLGYVVASYGLGSVSSVLGGNFSYVISAQAIVIGVCFASGLCPIVNKYGWLAGCVGAMLHYMIVTTVPDVHGAFCLYNGGFTAALICILYIPVLENMCEKK